MRKHALMTCYDGRVDDIVNDLIAGIRNNGELLGKSIYRPAGGIHVLLGKSECRKAFYEMLTALRDIAGIDVFHLFPHTNCRYCGLNFSEKLGNGTRSDLRFHVQSAERMLLGLNHHFDRIGGAKPAFDVRIILTTDQRIVTIEEAQQLLPDIPADREHGHTCCLSACRTD
ncbi:MAG: hypothetical protein QG606_417 [Patescibacteria group bacterium]|nr:hypothetical protein [Patescibacteria group bacterium]